MKREELERLDDQGLAAWDAHDGEAWLALFADDFVWHDWTRPEPIRDRDGVLEYFNSWMTAFPDMHIKSMNRVVGDDAVAGEVEFTGTNTGPMIMAGNEIPPTNRMVTGRGTYFVRAVDGKIVEFRTQPDAAGMMMQLGLMPGM